MKCWECVEKHARDLEHHLEDIVRVETDPRKRLRYMELIDIIRRLRRESHAKAKDIAIEEIKPPEPREDATKYWELPPYEEKKSNPEDEETEVEFSEPIAIIRGKKTYTEVFHEPAECHPSSFRIIRPKAEHILTVCCPLGEWDESRPAGQQCLASMFAQKLEHLHPEGEGSCPVCGGA